MNLTLIFINFGIISDFWFPTTSLRQQQVCSNFLAFASFFLWIQMFYWLRLNDDFSLYIRLIKVTLSDVTPFMVLIFLILIAFADAVFILNKTEEIEASAITPADDADAGEDDAKYSIFTAIFS